MSDRFSENKRLVRFFKRSARLLPLCLFMALIDRGYYYVRECEARKAEEVIRCGIVFINQKNESAFLQLLSDPNSFDCAWMDRYIEFRKDLLHLDPGEYDRLQVGHVDMDFRLSSADVYLCMGNVPDYPLLPFSVNGIINFLFDRTLSSETLQEWMDGRMTLKFSVRKEKGKWKLASLPELIGR